MRTFVRFLIFLVVSSVAGGVRAAEVSDPAGKGRPAVRAYTSDSDGLPQNTVQALHVDRRGYLWAGTDHGAAVYNGHRWTTVEFPIRDLAIKRHSIFSSSDGSIWFGTGAGLLRLRDDKWEIHDATNGLPGNSVYGIAETFENGKSVIWCGVTGGGVCRLADGRWTVFNEANTPGIVNNKVISLLATQGADGKWSVWAGTIAGISRYVDGTWRGMTDKPKFFVPDGEGKLVLDDSVFCLAELHTPEGKKAVYAATPIGGIARWVDGAWSSFSVETRIPNAHVISLAETVDGAGKYVLWAGTEAGLYRYADGVWSWEDGELLRSVNILSLAVTSQGTGRPLIWSGTNNRGVVRLLDGGWRTLDEATGLPWKTVQCFSETSGDPGERTFVMGGMEGGIQAFRDGKWSPIKMPGAVFQNQRVFQFIRSAAFSKTPELVMGSTNHVMRFGDGRITTVESDPRLELGFIDCLAEITEIPGGKRLWAGTIEGVFRFDGAKWSKIEAENGPRGSVRALLETSDHFGRPTVWAGSERVGLFVLRDGVWSKLTTGDGLPSNQFYSLMEGQWPDGRPVIWAGTIGGLAVLDAAAPGRPLLVLTDSTTPALPNNVVFGFCRDRQGRVYATTNRGLIRLTIRKDVKPNESPVLLETFTTEDGLPDNQCLGQPYADSRGRIWVGTVAGVGVFDPEREPKSDQPKPLYIERAALGEKGTAIAPGVALRHDDNDPVFSYALLSYFREGETRYRTELVGYDRRPTDWTAETSRSFSNLPERDFTFRVWGRDYAGNVSGPVEFRFRVTPPLWRRWWAYLLYMGIAAGLTFGGVRLRIRTLANQNRLLEERIAERTTELAEAVEKLQAANADTSRKNRELDEKIAELEASQRQADRIFSALSEALPGTVLDDKYRLDEKIGSGGFGAVFKATHLGLNRPIAVKVFKPMPGNDSANAVERFRLEGVSVARLNHRNIVSVIDSGISREGIAYLVMELLQGHSLYEEVCARRPVLLSRCLQVLVPVCRALAEAHGNGVVHRDIKPSNIFLNRGEEGEVVKVVDFGTAKLLDPEDEDVFERLTETGAIIGTPNYLAPERIGGKPYDGRSDVYGVGIVFYQMLCGRVPFQPNQGNAMSILVSHLNTPPPPPSTFNPDIHPEVERVCLRALEKSPERRPTAEEFAAALETLWEFVGEEDPGGSSDGWFPVGSDHEAAFPTLGNFSNFENAPATQKYSGRDDEAASATTLGNPES